MTTTEKAVELLGAAFPGRIITPESSTAFDAEVTKPWSQTCWTRATAFVYLETPEQVAEALLIVKKVGCKFAIRTTGHNPNPGFSSLSGNGVVLDIRRLGSRTLTSEGVALIGAGNTWGEVYGWLQEQGLSAIGGRDEQVGIAGFLLGGKLDPLKASNKDDNNLSAQVD
jgi:FAD/FMN-containing dehydrogenase